jgi:type I restriction-modification system DNA methylase subunit
MSSPVSAMSPSYARAVSVAEIERNDYNLNLPRYIDSQADATN